MPVLQPSLFRLGKFLLSIYLVFHDVLIFYFYSLKLVAILKAIVIIDVGLQASLAVLVKAVVEAIKVLQFTDILAVLKIVV